jgi:hypothetical protein
MKAKISPLIFLLSIVCGTMVCTTSRAQDEASSSNESQEANHAELNPNEDRTIVFDHESKVKNGPRDSVQLHAKPVSATVAPAKSKPSDHTRPSNGKEEDDALSFNFLYYIIQKFKISDLIDN